MLCEAAGLDNCLFISYGGSVSMLHLIVRLVLVFEVEFKWGAHIHKMTPSCPGFEPKPSPLQANCSTTVLSPLSRYSAVLLYSFLDSLFYNCNSSVEIPEVKEFNCRHASLVASKLPSLHFINKIISNTRLMYWGARSTLSPHHNLINFITFHTEQLRHSPRVCSAKFFQNWSLLSSEANSHMR